MRKILLVFILFFLFFLTFQTNVFNYLGKKLFLEFHRNNYAIKVLELEKNPDYYTFFLLGRIYFVENKLQKSIENYNKSIELNPEFMQTYYGRGLAYGFTSSIFFSDAQKDFEKYIELDNLEFLNTGQHAYGAWAGYNDLAWIYFLKNDFQNMEKAARSGLNISMSNAWLSNMLGVSLLAQNKCEEAKPFLDASRKILEEMDAEKFGEAYSGDSPDFWKIGQEQMKKSVEENLNLCNK